MEKKRNDEDGLHFQLSESQNDCDHIYYVIIYSRLMLYSGLISLGGITIDIPLNV